MCGSIGGRTFFQLPLPNIALGHGRRERGHVEILRCERDLPRGEGCTPWSVDF